MNDPLAKRLREAGWRRKLTPAEEADLRAWLAGHPEHQGDWELESGLTEALDRLPDAPVPTNFTARVMQAVECETAADSGRRGWWNWTWRSLLPKTAVAVVVLGLGLVLYDEHLEAQRSELARKVATVSSVAAVSNPELLQDMEFIRHLDQTPVPDKELLALLQ